jgi:hypothetical protein
MSRLGAASTCSMVREMPYPTKLIRARHFAGPKTREVLLCLSIALAKEALRKAPYPGSACGSSALAILPIFGASGPHRRRAGEQNGLRGTARSWCRQDPVTPGNLPRSVSPHTLDPAFSRAIVGRSAPARGSTGHAFELGQRFNTWKRRERRYSATDFPRVKVGRFRCVAAFLSSRVPLWPSDVFRVCVAHERGLFCYLTVLLLPRVFLTSALLLATIALRAKACPGQQAEPG